MRALETPPLPLCSAQPMFFFVQCCHNIGRSPSFAFVLWIHNGGYGALVDRILALWETQSSNKNKPVIKIRSQHWSKLLSGTVVVHSGSQHCWLKWSSSARNPVTVALAWAHVCSLQPTDKCHNAILSILMINSYVQHIPGLNKWPALHKCVRPQEKWMERVCIWAKTEQRQLLLGIWSYFKQTDCRPMSLFALPAKGGCFESQQVFAQHPINSCSRHVWIHSRVMGEGDYRRQRSGEWHLATINRKYSSKGTSLLSTP